MARAPEDKLNYGPSLSPLSPHHTCHTHHEPLDFHVDDLDFLESHNSATRLPSSKLENGEAAHEFRGTGNFTHYDTSCNPGKENIKMSNVSLPSSCSINKKQILVTVGCLVLFSAVAVLLYPSSSYYGSTTLTSLHNAAVEGSQTTPPLPIETQQATITEEEGPIVTKVLEQIMHDAAHVPDVVYPFVDLTAGERCDVTVAVDNSKETDASSTHVQVHNDNGIVTVYLTARDIQGNIRTYGGDVFRCELAQISGIAAGIGRDFRAYAFSYDHCNGTYTCGFDMRHAAAGTYRVVLVHLSRSFMHEVHLIDPPQCGAYVGSRYINTTDLINVGPLATKEIVFPNATVTVTPHPLSTFHLPPCTMAGPSAGRWVAQTVCFPSRTNEPTRNISTEGCRLGDEGMRVTDASVWVPFGCSLKYISPDDFARKAVGVGQSRIVILGDSRSYNLWLSMVQYLHGVRPDPTTGILLNDEDLATNLTTRRETTYHGKTVSPYYESYTAHNVTVELFQSYGTSDHFEQLPCPEIPGTVMATYANYRKLKGTWFEKLDILSAAPPHAQHDVIILQDGGVHDMFFSFSETRYTHSIRRIISNLKSKFQGKRIIYLTLPAANVRNFIMGFPHRSEYHQWRRSQIGRKMFLEAGYEVWDIHQMTATRADRYFDAMHFFPKPFYARKWNDMPMLLAHELMQDLVNRMYEWP